jgi:hypothetical protein
MISQGMKDFVSYFSSCDKPIELNWEFKILHEVHKLYAQQKCRKGISVNKTA